MNKARTPPRRNSRPRAIKRHAAKLYDAARNPLVRRDAEYGVLGAVNNATEYCKELVASRVARTGDPCCGEVLALHVLHDALQEIGGIESQLYEEREEFCTPGPLVHQDPKRS